MSLAEELERLNEMRETGALTDADYEKAKSRLLDAPPPIPGEGGGPGSMTESQVNNWAMFIHLSQFCGYVVPLAGLVVPIILWQMKKDESPILDTHGLAVVNWILSVLVYAVICSVLILVFIGIPMLVVLGVLCLVFPIIGGIKAGNGEVWGYPLTIRFLSPREPQAS